MQSQPNFTGLGNFRVVAVRHGPAADARGGEEAASGGARRRRELGARLA